MLETVKTKRPKCVRCGGTLRWDDDDMDPGLFCLNCGHRYRPRTVRPVEDGRIRTRQPAHAGSRL